MLLMGPDIITMIKISPKTQSKNSTIECKTNPQISQSIISSRLIYDWQNLAMQKYDVGI